MRGVLPPRGVDERRSPYLVRVLGMRFVTFSHTADPQLSGSEATMSDTKLPKPVEDALSVLDRAEFFRHADALAAWALEVMRERDEARETLAAEKAMTDALVDSLDQCGSPGCDRRATKTFTGDGWADHCDECLGGEPSDWFVDLPYAEPLRAIQAARKAEE